jgi:hypothetical protein
MLAAGHVLPFELSPIPCLAIAGTSRASWRSEKLPRISPTSRHLVDQDQTDFIDARDASSPPHFAPITFSGGCLIRSLRQEVTTSEVRNATLCLQDHAKCHRVPRRFRDFESGASTSSAIPALKNFNELAILSSFASLSCIVCNRICHRLALKRGVKPPSGITQVAGRSQCYSGRRGPG